MAYQLFKMASKWQRGPWHTDYCFVSYTPTLVIFSALVQTAVLHLYMFSINDGSDCDISLPHYNLKACFEERTVAYRFLFSAAEYPSQDMLIPEMFPFVWYYGLWHMDNIWLNKAPDNIFIFIVIVLYMYITNLFNYFLPLLLFS